MKNRALTLILLLFCFQFNSSLVSAQGKRSVRTITHPGILHTKESLQAMKKGVDMKKEPFMEGFKALKNHRRSSSSYNVLGGFEEVGRKPSVRIHEHTGDADAAYQNAMMWAITGDRAHADKSIEIINAWSSTLKRITGKDAILAAGISGIKFAAAAEVLRHTNSRWKESDIEQCEKMLTEIYYPVCKDMADFANGNWALAALQTVIAIAIFTDDVSLLNKGFRWFYTGKDNARLTHYIINRDGQCQESGRDQQHTMLGIGYLATIAEMGWSQGLNLYGAKNNRILAAFEYTASYNLGNEVPFEATVDTTGKHRHNAISDIGRGDFDSRPIFEMVYNHYKHRKGLECPFTEQVVKQQRPEEEGANGDHFGFGTILFAHEER